MAENMNKEGSSSTSMESDSCPICLGPITQQSYLDRCFHKFCYNCIVHWTKVVSSKHSHPPSSVKCPLCKTDNFGIIHGYDGFSFQRHYINQNLGNCNFFLKAHKYRLQCYYIDPGNNLIDKFNVSRFWKSRKYLQRSHWLLSWIRRELQALIQEEDVDIIAHHVLGVIESYQRYKQKYSTTPESAQEEFKAQVTQAARPFLGGRTDRFVSELELFLASGLNIDAYDKVYIRQLGWKIPELVSEEEEAESQQPAPLVPYMYFFDSDSDGND